MNLLILIDRIEQMAAAGFKIPFTSLVIVDVNELRRLLEKIKASIPEELQKAERVAEEKDRLIKESQAEAERIVIQAEEYVAKLVSEDAIVKKAQKEAEETIEQAKKRAAEIEKGANDYANEVLSDLYNALEATMKVVKKGRDQLRTKV